MPVSRITFFIDLIMTTRSLESDVQWSAFRWSACLLVLVFSEGNDNDNDAAELLEGLRFHIGSLERTRSQMAAPRCRVSRLGRPVQIPRATVSVKPTSM